MKNKMKNKCSQRTATVIIYSNMKIRILIWVVALFFVSFSKALACGDARDPNGCSPDFYYIMHTFPRCAENEKVPWYKDVRPIKYVRGVKINCDGNDEKDSEVYNKSKIYKSKIHKYLVKYPMRNLFDGDTKTMWVEAIQGFGRGLIFTIGSNNGDLTFEKLKIVNGCARDPTVYKNNNRVKTLMVFSALNEYEKVGVADMVEPQIITLKRPFKAAALLLGIEDVYKGSKYDDTCISELRFITKEAGEWPSSPQYLIETRAVQNEIPDYVYPSYTFFANNKEVASLTEGNVFLVSPSGVAFIENSMGRTSLLVNIPDTKGSVDSYKMDSKYLAFEEGGPLLNISSDEDMAISVGWIDSERLCLMKINNNGNGIFYLYQVKNNKLHFISKKEVLDSEIQKVAITHAKSIDLGAKEYIYYRQFCSVSNF